MGGIANDGKEIEAFGHRALNRRCEVLYTAKSIGLFLICALFFVAAGAQVADLQPTGPQPTIVDESGRRVALYSASYALLVSQRSYLGVAKGGWRPLEATTREMDAVAETLRRHGFTVRRATDLNSAELISVFRDFMADFGYKADNRLIFFFSGHGHTNTQNDIGYLVPIDAPDPNITPAKFYAKALPIDTVQTWARELTARHVLFLFDSCFSGSIFLSRAAITAPEVRGSSVGDRVAFFRGSSFKPVRQFIAAGGPKEELPATSIFVPLFIEALDGRASKTSDGFVTGKELGLWLEQTLPRFRQNQNPHSGIIRQPDLSFGDMVFQVPLRNSDSTTTQPVPTPSQQVAIAPLTPPRPVIEKVTFAADAFFEFSRVELKPDIEAKLNDLAKKARSVNLEVIIVVGHTDSAEGGSGAARQKLSESRAESIKRYLVSLGIEKNRIYTEGKGGTEPIEDNKTIEGRARNRRVEIEAVGTRTRPQ